MKTRVLIKPLTFIGAYLLLTLMVFLQSCVSEEDLDLPDDTDNESLSESIAIVSVLRAVQNEKLLENGCFQFLFPLQFQFNNDLQITVSDFSGLKEVANSVTIAQHIDAVEFPFVVTKGDLLKTISNEQEFINLLDDCEVLTLRDEFDPFFTQCFDLTYPIKMLDTDSNEVTIDSKTSYFEFERQQGFDKQPKFVYPFELFDYSSEMNVPIRSAFELFEVFDTCEKCPQLFFSFDSLRINRFEFSADFERIDEISYGWYINDEKVETDGGAVGGDNRFTETFPSGEYRICIRTSLPDGDCFSGTEYCIDLSVDACPDISFITEQLNNQTYEFIANFQSKDLIDYYWLIFQGQEQLFSELEDSQGDNKLVYQFNPGDYTICLEAEIEGCPQALKVCSELIVQ